MPAKGRLRAPGTPPWPQGTPPGPLNPNHLGSGAGRPGTGAGGRFPQEAQGRRTQDCALGVCCVSVIWALPQTTFEFRGIRYENGTARSGASKIKNAKRGQSAAKY